MHLPARRLPEPHQPENLSWVLPYHSLPPARQSSPRALVSLRRRLDPGVSGKQHRPAEVID
jgi:hypothetical protein